LVNLFLSLVFLLVLSIIVDILDHVAIKDFQSSREDSGERGSIFIFSNFTVLTTNRNRKSQERHEISNALALLVAAPLAYAQQATPSPSAATAPAKNTGKSPHLPRRLRPQQAQPPAQHVERRIASGRPDYWDFATQLEIAMLAKDEAGAMEALSKAVAVVRERWESETTLRNLRLIREAREHQGGIAPWMLSVEEEIKRATVS
jgi:hypothetical protein